MNSVSLLSWPHEDIYMVTPLIIRSVGSQRSGFGGSAGSRGESGCRTDSISGVIDIQNVAMSAGSISRWSLAIYVIDIAININLLLICLV